MPIVVSCRCGKKFAAKDHLVGQQVPCPACGRSLPIVATISPATQGIYVSCACGRAFLAPESLRGGQANCPGCRRVIQVPGQADNDPLGLHALPTGPDMLGQLPPAFSVAEPEAEIPWDTLKLVIGGGVFFLIVLAIIVSTVSYMRTDQQTAVANADSATAVPADVSQVATSPTTSAPSSSLPPPPLPTTAPPPSLSPSPPPAVAATTGEPTSAPTGDAAPADLRTATTTPRANVTGKAAPANDPGAVARLPDAIRQWHAQPDGRLSGIRRVNATDQPIAHFSWLTGLLPFLGHKKLYDEFDFQKPIEGKNLQLGGVLVPEFLNPLDDNQRWRGYPFPGIALTHFVGISGVEDARNVVAAKLPRADPRAGVFGYDQVVRPADIVDGQSQTAMVAGAGSLANPWIFGGGATIRGAREPLFDKTSGLGTKGLAGGGTIVVMADGSVRRVPANIDPRVFKAMCTIRGADSVDLDQAGKPLDLQTLKSSKTSP